MPTLIFIPGAWHKPTCYNKIIALLSPHHKCVKVTLPSTTDNPSATFKDDLTAAQLAIETETSAGLSVVLIAHSYGGMVANSAIKGFAPPSPPHTNRATGAVIGLILIASGFTFTGLSFMDPFLGNPPPGWRANWESGYAELVTPARELFYHDVDEADAEVAIAELGTQSLKALFEGGEHSYAGWMDVRAWYLGTTEDRGLPVVVQRMGVGMARGMGGVIVHREIGTSHSPFLSRPVETADVIMEAVKDFVGDGRVEGEEEEVVAERPGEGKQVVLVPVARLWRPVTWVRFGLPLVFGHLIGRGILVFGWGRRLWRSAFH
ncbi:alpha/beta-hydrolase [Penicillium verhagenii]|uniref:alpha/beta-hydrolase n=1 Tax=Penicillium verhagenii TaxID=1562060 RepID=UPI002544EC69|nr:alpha/beta-hydrolase [Penicillium verhagenii]KAJ5936926.1 alpha/beta-hydrolase [Penicillium verhagenii]